MADASRFPRLALPFATVGASGAWLSLGMLADHFEDVARCAPFTTVVAALLAALTGASLQRLCVGRQYAYGTEDADPDRRPSTDVWPLHVGVVLAAGAATGMLLGLAFAYDPLDGAWACGLGGAACAVVFVPVCLAVLAAARRAQRARLGSLVAASDRRAVWGILAITLAVATLEALPEWRSSANGARMPPLVALAMVVAAGAVTAGIFFADGLALRRARRMIASAPSAREPDAVEPDDPGIARLDLGLGNELSARSAMGAAYRSQERTLALVRGSPGEALTALRRAVRQSVCGLVAIAAVGGCHALATTPFAWDRIEALRERLAAWTAVGDRDARSSTR